MVAPDLNGNYFLIDGCYGKEGASYKETGYGVRYLIFKIVNLKYQEMCVRKLG